VVVRLAADPAGIHMDGVAILNLAGPDVLKTDVTALPNQISATLPNTSDQLISVLDERLKVYTSSGDYCVSLQSSGDS
jgi:hypothetical protein